MSINSVLFYIVAFDALMVLGMGLFAAGLIIANKENKAFWNRIVPATVMIVGTSIAAGVILWIGDYMFVS